MKISQQGLCLALVAAGLAAVPGLSASAAGPASQAAAGDSLVSRLKAEAQGTARITTEPATGKVGFAQATDLLPSVGASTADTAAAKSTAYLEEYAAAFGASATQLEQSGVTADDLGWTVDYTQRYRGLEVFGARLRAHVDKQGDLTSVNGYAAPNLELDVTPTFSESDAAARAVRTVRADPPFDGAAVGNLEAAENDLIVYRLGSTKGEAGKAILAYAIEVSNGHDVRDMVILDADTGKPVNRYSLVHDYLDRELYEASVNNGGTPDDPADDSVALDRVWREGNPRTGLSQSQLDLVDGTGDSYWFFRNSFGRDSYDGEGATMRTVNNDPRISCPNANWNGVTTNYCNGVTSDDTVAHEWGHAYTEYTSGLVYQWQSGAMNESFSDIWGETVDQINARYNETPNSPRTVGQCSAFTRGDVEMTINAPASIAGPCEAVAASFGPVFDDAGVTSDVVVAQDGTADGGTTTDACSPFTNAAAVAGRFAYADRGTCTFATKARNAEAAGATGIVVGQNDPAADPVSMTGDADIYGVMVGYEDGQRIKAAAATGTVNVTVSAAGEEPTDNSYRWLSGEGDPAFGGAIRDMWNPTCYGDPGKVTDAQYFCSADDSGGVHSNSGVPNHAYALLVDGGTYNGVQVPGIGLTKAAHIFWRTQANYLTPTSDFTDLADGLAQSCTDLTGKRVNNLSVAERDQTAYAEPVTAADCAAVTAVSQAVELRTDPVQCNFKPILDPNAPSVCGDGLSTEVAWSEDFEDGLTGWTPSSQVVFEGGINDPWKASTDAPAGHADGVAYGPAPDEGQCVNGPGDFSSRDSITSPTVTYPTGQAPKLLFDHYVATEVGYDGGNVKVSVNGGAFAVVPAAAYVFNGPNATIITAAAGNTNPLAGERGWTGTDGGEPTGSWGQTQVDLSQLGKAGDQLQFRFDIGRDGCGGLDGWYVDDIKVVYCSDGTEVPPGEPGQPGQVSSSTSADAKPGTVKAGKRFTAVVKVRATGAQPSGTVRILDRGRSVGRATLGSSGKVTIRLTAKKSWGTGKRTLVAQYLGSRAVKASQDTFRVRVVRARR
ncbi:M4 family metallopeptidase [Nocardioides pantholopis]|uniref:M4 family metallopeptidase n=1 Tax=Nocardioides pantholopis TaxID=2483798 RepID=UPI000F08713B|nr:M4 family metallopeptidase [Nocardioides pantholopis]